MFTNTVYLSRGGLMVSAMDSGWSDPGSNPGYLTPTLSLFTPEYMGTGKLSGKPDKNAG